MFQYLYEWIQNIAFYLVIATTVIQVLPGKEYKKYLQFFTGMVMILLLLTPLLKLTGMEHTFQSLYQSNEYEMEKREIEEQENFFSQQSYLDFLPDTYPENEEQSEENKIEVGEIVVGE